MVIVSFSSEVSNIFGFRKVSETIPRSDVTSVIQAIYQKQFRNGSTKCENHKFVSIISFFIIAIYIICTSSICSMWLVKCV